MRWNLIVTLFPSTLPITFDFSTAMWRLIWALKKKKGFHTWSAHQPKHTLKLFTLKLLKMLRHVSIIRSSLGSCLFLAKVTLLKTFTAWFSYNNLVMWQHVVLCRSSVARSAPDCVCRVLCITVYASVGVPIKWLCEVHGATIKRISYIRLMLFVHFNADSL